METTNLTVWDAILFGREYIHEEDKDFILNLSKKYQIERFEIETLVKLCRGGLPILEIKKDYSKEKKALKNIIGKKIKHVSFKLRNSSIKFENPEIIEKLLKTAIKEYLFCVDDLNIPKKENTNTLCKNDFILRDSPQNYTIISFTEYLQNRLAKTIKSKTKISVIICELFVYFNINYSLYPFDKAKLNNSKYCNDYVIKIIRGKSNKAYKDYITECLPV